MYKAKPTLVETLRKMAEAAHKHVEGRNKRKIGLEVEEVKKPVFVERPMFDTYASELINRFEAKEGGQEWLEWKSEQKVPSASMLSSVFGIGYRPFKEEIETVLKIREQKPTDNFFVAKLLEHGLTYEKLAADLYSIDHDIKKHEIVGGPINSAVYKLTMEDKTFDFLITPDMVYVHPEKGICVTEFKCPGYGIAVNRNDNVSISDLCVKFNSKHERGRLHHFIQVAAYAVTLKARYFSLYYLFTEGINQYTIEYQYQVTHDVIDLIRYALGVGKSTGRFR
jgi:hypothetical protein